MRRLDPRILVSGFHFRTGECAAIHQSRFVSSFLAHYIFFEPASLLVPQRMQRTIVKCAVKSDPGSVQLLRHRGVEPLLRDQQLHIATPEGSRDRRVKERLQKSSISETEPLDRLLTRAMAALNASGNSDDCIGQSDRPEYQALPGGLFKAAFCSLNLWIFFNGRLKRGLQGKSEGPRRRKSDQTTKKGGLEKQSFHRCVSFAGGCTTSATCLPRRSLDCPVIFGLNSSPSGFVAQARASLATARLCK